MTGILLALAGSALWGSSDFLAGQASRRLPLLAVLLTSRAAGLGVLLVVLAVRGSAIPAAAIGWGAAAGAVGVGSVSSFYRALAVDTMSVVAPIVATCAALPVLAGVACGGHPSIPAALGMLAAMIGVVLASRSPHRPPTEGTGSASCSPGSPPCCSGWN